MQNRWVKYGNFQFDYRDYNMAVTGEDREASTHLYVEYENGGDCISGQAWQDEIAITYTTKNKVLAKKIFESVRNHNFNEDNKVHRFLCKADLTIPQTIEKFFRIISPICPDITSEFIDSVYKEISVVRPVEPKAEEKQEVLKAPNKDGVFGKSKISHDEAAAVPVLDGSTFRP